MKSEFENLSICLFITYHLYVHSSHILICTTCMSVIIYICWCIYHLPNFLLCMSVCILSHMYLTTTYLPIISFSVLYFTFIYLYIYLFTHLYVNLYILTSTHLSISGLSSSPVSICSSICFHPHPIPPLASSTYISREKAGLFGILIMKNHPILHSIWHRGFTSAQVSCSQGCYWYWR